MTRLPDWLTWGIIGLVAAMAGTNFFAPFFLKGYQSNEVINGLFAAIVTTVILNRRGGGGSGDSGKRPAEDEAE
jgi:hypothetical protein